MVKLCCMLQEASGHSVLLCIRNGNTVGRGSEEEGHRERKPGLCFLMIMHFYKFCQEIFVLTQWG